MWSCHLLFFFDCLFSICSFQDLTKPTVYPCWGVLRSHRRRLHWNNKGNSVLMFYFDDIQDKPRPLSTIGNICASTFGWYMTAFCCRRMISRLANKAELGMNQSGSWKIKCNIWLTRKEHRDKNMRLLSPACVRVVPIMIACKIKVLCMMWVSSIFLLGSLLTLWIALEKYNPLELSISCEAWRFILATESKSCMDSVKSVK